MTSLLSIHARSFLEQFSSLLPDPTTPYLVATGEVFALSKKKKNLSTLEIIHCSRKLFAALQIDPASDKGSREPLALSRERVTLLKTLEQSLGTYATRLERGMRRRWYIRLLSSLGFSPSLQSVALLKVREDIQTALIPLQGWVQKKEEVAIQHKKARSIQRAWHGHRERVKVRSALERYRIQRLEENKQEKARVIQKAWHRHRGPVRVLWALKQHRIQQQEAKKTALIVSMQSVCRMRLAKKYAQKEREYVLSFPLFEKAKEYLQSSKYQTLPRACGGYARVFLPRDVPVVLKTGTSRGREKAMREARDFCKQNTYTHLIVPKVRVVAPNWYIESRLPINSRLHAQLSLYSEQRALFTDAVKEFTGFLCQTSFGDLFGRGSLLESKKGVDLGLEYTLGRYDNIPLYVENGRGYIGLIDLESWHLLPTGKAIGSCYGACLTAILLFPYHFETIIEEVKKFDPSIVASHSALERVRDFSLLQLKVHYENHVDFLKANNISFANPTALFPYQRLQDEMPSLWQATKEAAMAVTKEAISKELWETCENQVFPELVHFLYQCMHEFLQRNLNKREGSPVNSYWELVDLRALDTCSVGLRIDQFFKMLRSVEEKKGKELSFQTEMDLQSLLKTIRDCFLQELVKRKYISYYNPEYMGWPHIHC